MEKTPQWRTLKFFTFKSSPTMRFMRQLIANHPPINLAIAGAPNEAHLIDKDAMLAVDDPQLWPPDRSDDGRDTGQNSVITAPLDQALTAQIIVPEVDFSDFSQFHQDVEIPVTMQQLTQSEPDLNSNYALNYDIVTPFPHPNDNAEATTEQFNQPGLKGLFAVTNQMRQATTIDNLFNTTVAEVRQYLKTDRVLIYRFENEHQGVVMAESMAGGYTPSLQEILPAIMFGVKHPRNYQHQPFIAINEVVPAAVTPYQLQLLERFQVKASLSLPIWVGNQTWGLLIAQQCSSLRRWDATEISWLDQVVRELRLTLQPVAARAQKHKQIEQDNVMANMIKKMHEAADVDSLFDATTQAVRQQLKCDRVAVYSFNPDWSGQFVAESVGKSWVALAKPGLKTGWADSYLQETQGGRYRNHETLAVDDIYSTEHSPCHREMLEGFEVRAYTIAPIFDGEILWGLLGAYQNSGPRYWESAEVNWLAQVGRQFGLAIRQAEYLTQVRLEITQLRQESDQRQAITRVIDKLRQSSDINTIFKTVTQELRKLLNVERLTIYKFRPDFFGDFVAESEARGLPPLVGGGWEDPYLQEHQGGRFCNNEPLVIDNIAKAELSDCHVEALEVYDVKACLVVSIFQGQNLWGLLSAFQVSTERHWLAGEVQLMMQISAQLGVALQQAEYLEQLRIQAEQLAKTAERERFIARTGDRIRQSLDLQKTFKVTAREIRSFLQVDRVAIFKFDPGYSDGSTIVEDVTPGFVSALAINVTDHCFSAEMAQQYKKGRVWALDDLYESEMAACYIELLSQFQVRANLVVPLFKGEELWGLFCIHQCSGPRQWQAAELEFAKQIAAQLNVAIQQEEYIEQLQQQAQQLAEAAQQEKSAKEQLQQEVIQLLMAVRPALGGDLTVRAPLTDTAVGTVADAYNNTLGSLRQIVTQMQTAANQVSQTTETSSVSIMTLTHQAQAQLQAIDQALERVQKMVGSTEAVEANAHQVEVAVQQANQTILAGDAAIDRTVEEMDEIRATVLETSQRLQRLSESSQKISRVVNLIGNFTTQTQLLALNASIEATRAGEFGRGFGVVADEVRSLARQSASAATEIEQLVQEIQAGTAEVSTAMETGIQQVASGTKVVNEARQNLNAIVDATAQISQLVTGITQATHAQTQECQSVTQTMTKVAAIANQTSTDSLTISDSFKDLLATAQDLQAKSGKFKVN
jgi:methyl-accepting chemotaxis protein PixJ